MYQTGCKEREATPVSISLYRTICKEFNSELARLLIEDGITYVLPYRLGELSIRRRKMRFAKLKFDYGHYNKTKELSYHTNQHSSEWYSFCEWNRVKCKIKGKRAYQFILTRDNKRKLAKLMQHEDGYKIYQESSIKRNKK